MKFLNSNGVSILWNAIKNFVGTSIEEGVDDKLGVANGIATLGSDGIIKSNQLPSFKTVNGNTIVGNGDITIDLNIYSVVESLPTTNINPHKIYLVINANGIDSNKYNEYAYIDNKWELIGEYKAEVDLTPYVKKTDIVTTTDNGIMLATDKVRLDGIDDNATKDEAITNDELNAILV